MDRGLADDVVRVIQEVTHLHTSLGVVDPCERPDGIAPRGSGAIRPRVLQQIRENTRRYTVAAARLTVRDSSERFNGPVLYSGPRISEQRNRLSHTQKVLSTPQLFPSWIFDLGRTLAADAVDPPQHVGLVQLRGRAAELVPAAGVDDDEAAVGVLDDVGGMEVEIGTVTKSSSLVEKVAPSGVRTCRADLVQVEIAGENVVFVCRCRMRSTRSGSIRRGRPVPYVASTGMVSGPVHLWAGW